jgi:hypothetical protein
MERARLRIVFAVIIVAGVVFFRMSRLLRQAFQHFPIDL